MPTDGNISIVADNGNINIAPSNQTIVQYEIENVTKVVIDLITHQRVTVTEVDLLLHFYIVSFTSAKQRKFFNGNYFFWN